PSADEVVATGNAAVRHGVLCLAKPAISGIEMLRQLYRPRPVSPHRLSARSNGNAGVGNHCELSSIGDKSDLHFAGVECGFHSRTSAPTICQHFHWQSRCLSARMIQSRDIICFSNDWDSDPLSKKHIMLRLAKHNRVLWINSIGNRKPTASVHDLKRIGAKLRAFTRGHQQVHEGIYVYSPISIPFFGNGVARWLNRKALRWSLRRTCRKLGFKNPITWTFL